MKHEKEMLVSILNRATNLLTTDGYQFFTSGFKINLFILPRLFLLDIMIL